MNPQPTTQVQAGLKLICMGHRMIAEADISEADVLEAFNRDRNGDNRLMRRLSKKPGFIDMVMVLAERA